MVNGILFHGTKVSAKIAPLQPASLWGLPFGV